MSDYNVLVIGASGYIGSHLYSRLSKEFPTRGTFYSRPDDNLIYLDVTDVKSLQSCFRHQLPSLILYLAAEANVDVCERQAEVSYRVNVQGLKNILEQCIKYQIKILYVSTDYVFDGLSGPYSEEDTACPINNYGKHKYEGESLTRSMVTDHLVVRTSVVYGNKEKPCPKILKVLDDIKYRQYHDASKKHYNSPTFINDLTSGILNLVKSHKTGTYHIAGPQVCSRYDFASAICNAYGYNKSFIREESFVDQENRAKRPQKCGLQIEKARKDVGYDPAVLEKALRE